MSNAHWESKDILGSGDLMWTSEVHGKTDSIINILLDLTESYIDFKVKLNESRQLHTELSLHNLTNNIELETDKCFEFCAGLRDAEISEMGSEVESKLNAYTSKYLKSRVAKLFGITTD